MNEQAKLTDRNLTCHYNRAVEGKEAGTGFATVNTNLKEVQMKQITHLIIIITLILTGLGVIGITKVTGTELTVYKLLKIEHTVGPTPDVEGIGATAAVYFHEEDMIMIRKQYEGESIEAYFQLVLHELIHYSGSRKERALHWPFLDLFQEEIVAEVGANILSEKIYGGKFRCTKAELEATESYLDNHSHYRELTKHEWSEVKYCIKASVEWLLKVLKEADKHNTLEIK